jgi:hypothetical protein
VRGAGLDIFNVVGLSFLFIAWAVATMHLVARPDPEDFFYNRQIQIPFVEQAASDGLSQCLAYSVVQALDHNAPHHLISEVTQPTVSQYFDSCKSNFFSDLSSVAAGEGLSITKLNYAGSGPVCVGGDCNHVKLDGTLHFEFNIPLSAFGFSGDWAGTKSISVRKEMNVEDTGLVDAASGRPIYRVLVTDLSLSRVEVNGVWPQ